MATEVFDHEILPSTVPTPSSAEQRFMYEELAKRIDKAEELIEKAKSKAKDDIQKESAILQATLRAEYSSKIEAVKAQADSFDGFLKLAKFTIVLLAGGFAALTFTVGKSAYDVREDAQAIAEQKINETIRAKTGIAGEITDIIKSVEQYKQDISAAKEELKGYTTLASTVEAASNFDPLILYYHLDDLIDKIENDGSADDILQNGERITYKSFKDVAFRQYAALVFSRIIHSLEEDQKNKASRINPDELYNIAANASKVDMDFVSLQVMTLASKITNKSRPEIDIRLLRHQVAAGQVPVEEALQKLQAILATANSLTLHLTVSEAFNLGVHTQSLEKVSQILAESLPKNLQSISYVLLNRGQLLMLAGLPDQWAQGLNLFRQGLVALATEAPLARWYSHSWGDAAKFLRRDNKLLNATRPDFEALFRKTQEAQGGSLPKEAILTQMLLKLSGN